MIKKQIQELTDAIRKEIDLIKKADASFINDVKDVENLTINSLPENGYLSYSFLGVRIKYIEDFKS